MSWEGSIMFNLKTPENVQLSGSSVVPAEWTSPVPPEWAVTRKEMESHGMCGL